MTRRPWPDLPDAIFIACHDKPREDSMASRRELIKAIGAAAVALPTITDATVLAQGTNSPPIDAAAATGGRFSQAATEAFLAQFETAWRPLDPQLRFVLRLIYARLQGLPPPAQLPPAELRRINGSLSFFFNAGRRRCRMSRRRRSTCRAAAPRYGSTIPARPPPHPPWFSSTGAAGSWAVSTSMTASRARLRNAPACAA